MRLPIKPVVKVVWYLPHSTSSTHPAIPPRPRQATGFILGENEGKSLPLEKISCLKYHVLIWIETLVPKSLVFIA